jgi:hypothetical protein
MHDEWQNGREGQHVESENEMGLGVEINYV